MGTQYAADTGGAPDGRDNFVAAFAQTDEGDSVPDLFVFAKDINGGNGPGEGVPYAQRGGTAEPYELDEPGYQLGQPQTPEISGTTQLAQALGDPGKGGWLGGPGDQHC